MSQHPHRRTISRATAALGVAVLATLTVAPGLASAHVKAHAQQATKGGYSKITFSVPNEDEHASTVKVEVDFPKDHPLASVSTKAMPGWHAQVTKVALPKPIKMEHTEVKEAVASIVWTADPGAGIAPGQFNEFDVSAGPLPTDTDTLIIPATQTYDDGNVVKWDETQAAGQSEPEHPAPTVALAAKKTDAAATTTAAQPGEQASSADDTARLLGGIGVGLGVLGIGIGVGTTLRARRNISSADTE